MVEFHRDPAETHQNQTLKANKMRFAPKEQNTEGVSINTLM